MAKSKTPNVRIKRAYIDFLRQAMGRSEGSLEAVAAALHRFECYTGFRDFGEFHIGQAKGFKAHLARETNTRTGGELSAATIYSTLGALKAFFRWLSGQAAQIGQVVRIAIGVAAGPVVNGFQGVGRRLCRPPKAIKFSVQIVGLRRDGDEQPPPALR